MEKKVEEKDQEMEILPITEETIKTHPELLIGPERSIFDRPCPDSGSLDLSKCDEVQEWVFNHLPLSHEQKKEFLQVLIRDNKIQEKKKKQKKNLEKMKKKDKIKTRVQSPKKRQPVKKQS